MSTGALLRRDDAAAYVGMGHSQFDKLRARADFPEPVWLDSYPRWSRDDLDAWVASLPRSAAAPSKPATAPATPITAVRHRRSKHDRPAA